MDLKALKSFRHGSTVYKRGALLPVLSEAAAKPLFKSGLIERVKPDETKKPSKKTDKDAE